MTDQEKEKAEALISQLEIAVGQVFPRDGQRQTHRVDDSIAEWTEEHTGADQAALRRLISVGGYKVRALRYEL